MENLVLTQQSREPHFLYLQTGVYCCFTSVKTHVLVCLQEPFLNHPAFLTNPSHCTFLANTIAPGETTLQRSHREFQPKASTQKVSIPKDIRPPATVLQVSCLKSWKEVLFGYETILLTYISKQDHDEELWLFLLGNFSNLTFGLWKWESGNFFQTAVPDSSWTTYVRGSHSVRKTWMDKHAVPHACVWTWARACVL